MAKTFWIWGAGGHGKVLADVLRASHGEVTLKYVELDEARVGEMAEPGGGRVECTEEEFLERVAGAFEAPVILAVGNNEARLEMLVRLKARGVDLPAVVHPSATLSPSATLGMGSQLVTGAVVHPDSRIGEAVIINTRAVVEHDCVVGDGCHISPGAVLAGGVTVGAKSWIGAGAVVINGKRIGAGCVVGAGAVVIDDVPDGATAVGVPASVL